MTILRSFVQIGLSAVILTPLALSAEVEKCFSTAKLGYKDTALKLSVSVDAKTIVQPMTCDLHYAGLLSSSTRTATSEAECYKKPWYARDTSLVTPGPLRPAAGRPNRKKITCLDTAKQLPCVNQQMTSLNELLAENKVAALFQTLAIRSIRVSFEDNLNTDRKGRDSDLYEGMDVKNHEFLIGVGQHSAGKCPTHYADELAAKLAAEASDLETRKAAVEQATHNGKSIGSQMSHTQDPYDEQPGVEDSPAVQPKQQRTSPTERAPSKKSDDMSGFKYIPY